MKAVVLFNLILTSFAIERSQLKSIIGNLTLEEKVQLMSGMQGAYIGNIAAIDRLGIPEQRLNDGPQGFRGIPGTSTQFPCLLAAAATFDRDMSHDFGAIMGAEFAAKEPTSSSAPVSTSGGCR